MNKFTYLQEWLKKVLEDSWWIDYLEKKDKDEDKNEEDWNLKNKVLETILRHSEKDKEIYTSLKLLKTNLKNADPANELSIGALKRSEGKVFKNVIESISTQRTPATQKKAQALSN